MAMYLSTSLFDSNPFRDSSTVLFKLYARRYAGKIFATRLGQSELPKKIGSPMPKICNSEYLVEFEYQ
jgi:hypothetical protein